MAKIIKNVSFAPIAGMVMLIVRYLMFKDLFLSITLMMDAMVSIVWSMGLLLAFGFLYRDTQMKAHSGPRSTGTQAAGALAASEKALYVGYTRWTPRRTASA